MTRRISKLETYQIAMDLAVEILPYAIRLRPYRIGEQIAASALSIPSNIAEGGAYDSEKDFMRFISYALGSAAELSTQLEILRRINPDEDKLSNWIDQSVRIQRMLSRLRKSISTKHS